MENKKIKIGTRGSPLALIQAQIVARLLAPHMTEIISLTTRGDQLNDQPLSALGGKGLFCKEIDHALLEGRIDIAVHSSKDMPTVLPDGLKIGAVLERGDPRDVWISPTHTSIAQLSQGEKVGTASLRRKAQLLANRPDLEVCILRGNIATRLEKINAQGLGGTFLAFSGIERLGRMEVATEVLSTAEMLPAVGQGILAVMCRDNDADLTQILAVLNHEVTHACFLAERHMLKILEGSCKTPIAGFASIYEGKLTLEGLLSTEDGRHIVRTKISCNDPVELGQVVASELQSKFK